MNIITNALLKTNHNRNPLGLSDANKCECKIFEELRIQLYIFPCS